MGAEWSMLEAKHPVRVVVATPILTMRLQSSEFVSSRDVEKRDVNPSSLYDLTRNNTSTRTCIACIDDEFRILTKRRVVDTIVIGRN